MKIEIFPYVLLFAVILLSSTNFTFAQNDKQEC